MSEAKHTPTPWKYEVEIRDCGGWDIPKQYVQIYTDNIIIADYDTAAMEYAETNEENEANAKFICLACNNHDALVEALSSLDDWVKTNTIASNRPAKLDALIMNVLAQIEKEQ